MQKKSKQEERKPRVMRWRGKDMKQGWKREETGEGYYKCVLVSQEL